jgi:prepilin-type N-terminal cleavage/methylation domain-containing protein
MRLLRRGARGVTLIELVVVVIAVGILAGAALERLLPLIGRAQRVAFLQVRSELQSALFLQAAEHVVRGESARIAELADANPMTLLLQPPANYLGAIAWSDPDEIPAHSWYYDTQRSRLVYRVGKHTRFKPLEGPANRIELLVRFVYDDRNDDGAYQAAGDSFAGLRLESAFRYEWPD